MKHLILVFIALTISACQKPKAPEDLQNSGKGTIFKQVQKKAFADSGAIEVSLLSFGGTIKAYHGHSSKGSVYLSNLGTTGLDYGETVFFGNDFKFSFILEYNGSLYQFALRGSDIYLFKSEDQVTWRKINGGRPVLKAEPGTIYQHLWNVGVAIDDNGIWHLLVESADGTGTSAEQGGVGLAYSTATMNGEEIEFDTNKSAGFVIPKGGNPEIKFVPGKGILIVHGSLEEGIWKTKATTFGSDEVWRTHHDFVVGTPGVHVCDPALVELSDGTTLLSVSYDQTSTTITKSELSISELYDFLVQ